ncbi:MAG: hypothetical protein GEV12_19375 [Micromonosporaceae bacterium]|nr:hypothetical protein [Micromonosporaceae bacterium]
MTELRDQRFTDTSYPGLAFSSTTCTCSRLAWKTATPPRTMNVRSKTSPSGSRRHCEVAGSAGWAGGASGGPVRAGLEVGDGVGLAEGVGLGDGDGLREGDGAGAAWRSWAADSRVGSSGLAAASNGCSPIHAPVTATTVASAQATTYARGLRIPTSCYTQYGVLHGYGAASGGRSRRAQRDAAFPH